MSLLALIAAEQAKNKVEQGYTPLPEDANWFDTLYTSLSNVPNVASDMVGGLVGLATSSDARKQLHKSVSDFTLGTMESGTTKRIPSTYTTASRTAPTTSTLPGRFRL